MRWSSRQLKTLILTAGGKDVTDATATSKHAVHAGDIKIAVCQVIADVLTSLRTRLSIGGWSDSLIASMRRRTIAQADLSPAAPNSALPLARVNDLPKQVAEMRLVRFIRAKKPVLANIDGQLSHSCQ